MLKLLVENGADTIINNLDANLMSPLSWSATEGFDDCVEYLLQQGAIADRIELVADKFYLLRPFN